MKKYILFLTLISLLSGCTSKNFETDKKPNIIMFLVDDMGWQDTSVPFWTEETPFNRRYNTPGMERLALEGMIFTQAYASSVCSPTRVSLMSGMNAARHRVTNWTLHRNASVDGKSKVLDYPKWNVNGIQPTDSIELATHATMLPQILKDNGYFTIHCGKAHFGAMNTPSADPLTCGFDVNIAGHAAGGLGSYLGKQNFGNKEKGSHTLPWGVPGLEKYHGDSIFLTEAMTLETKKALDKSLELKKPFYLYMAHYAVHIPLNAVLWEIRRERAVELMMEGFRFDDLRRWKHMDEEAAKEKLGRYIVAADYNNKIPIQNGAAAGYISREGVPPAFLDYYYLYPIPSDQIVLNPAIIQNPVWE